jgi:hypothetical protein
VNTRYKVLVAAALAAGVVFGGCVKRQEVSEPPPPLPAVQAPAQPTGKYGEVPGESVLAGKGIAAFEAQGETGRVEVSKVPVEGQPFEEALRAKVKTPSANIWDVQFRAASARRIRRGPPGGVGCA